MRKTVISTDSQQDLEELSVETSSKEIVPKNPLPHQNDALGEIDSALSLSGDDVRTTCVMACGTGKTLVGRWASDKLGPRTYLTEPSLGLIAQNLREWQLNTHGDRPEVLVVCSDRTVVKVNEDEQVITPEDLALMGARVTQNPDEISSFLQGTNSKKLLISTLHSSPLVKDAMKNEAVPRFDCTVIDEAHTTATREESTFATVLHADDIRSRTRLFLTGTPRIYKQSAENSTEEVYSMDDESIFGTRCHTLNFGVAIEKGLLSDYRVVVAGVSDKEAKLLKEKGFNKEELRSAIGQLALAKAIKKYNLNKILTFHGSIKKAELFSENFPSAFHESMPNHDIWTQAFNGKMPMSTRKALLEHLKELPSSTVSIGSNCRCLGIGIDLPALDGIALFEPKKEVDLIQAVGRVMRLSSTKPIGTIVIPVVIPDGANNEEVLQSSEFSKVWQVIRALKAHDNRMEAMCENISSSFESKGGSRSDLFLAISNLPKSLVKGVKAKVVSTGLGFRSEVLTESDIITWSKFHFDRHGKWPATNSKLNDVSHPDAPRGLTWSSIDGAGRQGVRGLKKGRTLARILEHLKKDIILEEDIAIWAKHHFHQEGVWPNRFSGDIQHPSAPSNLNWSNVYSSMYLGLRGLEKGRTLTQFLVPLQETCILSEKNIILWASYHYDKFGEWPTKKSMGILHEDAIPEITWEKIQAAGETGEMGLEAGRTLDKILAYVKETYLISENDILRWTKFHLLLTEEYPNSRSGIVLHPGAPAGITWFEIHLACKKGLRGLKNSKDLFENINSREDSNIILEEDIITWATYNVMQNGKWPFEETKLDIANMLSSDRSYLEIMTELKKEIIFRESDIIEWAKPFFLENGNLPNKNTTEPVKHPSAPKGLTWKTINNAINKSVGGLSVDRTIDNVLEALNIFIEENIITWAKHHKKQTGKWPTATQSFLLDPNAPKGLTWRIIDYSGREGIRGLKKGRTLSKILEPIKNAFIDEDTIIEWAKHHKEETGRLPAQDSGEVLHSDATFELTWKQLDSAGRNGSQGLEKGRVLAEIFSELRGDNTLSEEDITLWAKHHKNQTGNWPTQNSGLVLHPDAPEGLSWTAINSSGNHGNRGLKKGRTLAKILKVLKQNTESPNKRKKHKSYNFSEAEIITWAKYHEEQTGKWPSVRSGKISHPDAPDELTWSYINNSGRGGSNGLGKGRTLAKILEKLK